MKYSEILEASDSILGFEGTGTNLPTSAVIKLSKINRIFKPHVEDFRKAQEEITKRFGKSEDGRTYTFDKENRPLFDKEYKDLLDTDVEIAYVKIKQSELRGTMENIKAFTGLMAFFNYLIEE